MTENTVTLPRYFALKCKSSGKYLKLNPGQNSFGRSRLEFFEENVMSPYAKFESEPYSASHRTREELVHIKCCYNNKYWVRYSSGQTLISGGADAPEEDRSRWNCTLFKPEFVPSREHPGQLVRLLHVQLGRYAAKGYCGILHAEGSTYESSVYEVVNMVDKIQLPKYVVFKGDNGKYLKLHSTTYSPSAPGGFFIMPTTVFFHVPTLSFRGGDRTEPEAVFEVVPNNDGSINLRSDHAKLSCEVWEYTRDEPRWLVCGRATPSSLAKLAGKYHSTSFQVVKLSGDNVVALKSSMNDKFCKRLSRYPVNEGIAADTGNIGDSRVGITVEEPIVSRIIDGFVYHEDDARVHKQLVRKNPTPVDSYVNRSQAEAWRKYETSTWKRSTSIWNRTTTTITSSKRNVDLEVKVPKLPLQVKVQSEEFKQLTDTVTWGEIKEYKTKVKHGENYKVPPMTKVTVYEKVTNETRDVPFSYRQTDMLRDGTRVTYVLRDGLFTYTTTLIDTEEVQEKLAYYSN